MFEIKHWLKQFEQLALGLSMFLGVAIPALFFALLLAFGVFLSPDTQVVQSMLIAWSILLFQTMLYMGLYNAITGQRFSLYLSSIAIKPSNALAADITFSLLSSPLLIIHLGIVLSVSPSKWHMLTHGFALLLLQVLCALTTLVKPRHVIRFLLLGLFSIMLNILLSAQLNILDMLMLWLVLLGMVFLIPEFKFDSLRFVSPRYRFWLSFMTLPDESSSGHRLFMIFGFSAIATITGYVTYVNRPDFSIFISFASAQVLILLASIVQLSIGRFIQEHILFYKSYFIGRSFYINQYAVSTLVGLGLLTVIAMIYGNHLIVISQVIPLGACLWIANNYPKRLVIAYLLCIALSASLYFFFSHFAA